MSRNIRLPSFLTIKNTNKTVLTALITLSLLLTSFAFVGLDINNGIQSGILISGIFNYFACIALFGVVINYYKINTEIFVIVLAWITSLIVSVLVLVAYGEGFDNDFEYVNYIFAIILIILIIISLLTNLIRLVRSRLKKSKKT